MHLNLADSTSLAHLDGTTTGIVVTIVVMLPALGLFLALIYWSARDSAGTEGQLRPASSQGSLGTAERPASSQDSLGTAERPAINAASQGATDFLLDHAEHYEEASRS